MMSRSIVAVLAAIALNAPLCAQQTVDVPLEENDIGVAEVAAATTAAVPDMSETQSTTTVTDATAPSAAPAPATSPNLTPIVRDPFWPIDYDPNPPPKPVDPEPETKTVPPPPKLPEPGPTDWAKATKTLAPAMGHSVDPAGDKRFFAFLNNRLLTPGEIVPLKTPLFLFTWRVSLINATGVEFTPIAAKRLSDGAQFAPPSPAPETQ